jgi:DNA uptake protein and related DNA-binding proteins
VRIPAETELSEVVRARLEHLLGELEPVPVGGPRRALVSTESDVPGREPEKVPAGESAAGAGVAAPAPAALARVLSFGREHLVAVVLILVVGVVWTGYSLFQARTTPVAAAVAPTELATPALTPPPTPVATVLIHVLGAVRRPGVVTLNEGSRVQDAIAAAGGLAADADTGELNLAEVVVDGAQLKIGTTTHPGGELRSGAPDGVAGSGGAAEAKISLNSATLAQLDTLPGVGPVTAQKILDWRSEHGKFSAVTELQEVDGIGPKTYADLAGRVRL